MKCIFLSICHWRNNLKLRIITDDHDGDNEDNDDDDNEVSLGIFVAVWILLKFVSSLLVLPEFCFTPPNPDSPRFHPGHPPCPVLTSTFCHLLWIPCVCVRMSNIHEGKFFPGGGCFSVGVCYTCARVCVFVCVWKQPGCGAFWLLEDKKIPCCSDKITRDTRLVLPTVTFVCQLPTTCSFNSPCHSSQSGSLF